jgi:phosphohistidine phosphatase
MRTLYLLRHAKSSWSDASLSDFDRPLKGRGRKAAPLIGERLAKEKLKSPLLICSPAVRARETAELVLKSAKLSVDQRFDDRIYEASLRDLLPVVAEIPEARQTVIMVGHNPGLEELLEFLTGEYRRLPTAALAKIRLDVESWAEVKAGEGSLELFVTPKELEED